MRFPVMWRSSHPNLGNTHSFMSSAALLMCLLRICRRYVRRLQKRYTPNPHLDPDGEAAPVGQDASFKTPLVFVSLLRKGTPDKDRSEAKLASAFDFVSNINKFYVNMWVLNWLCSGKALISWKCKQRTTCWVWGLLQLTSKALSSINVLS